MKPASRPSRPIIFLWLSGGDSSASQQAASAPRACLHWRGCFTMLALLSSVFAASGPPGTDKEKTYLEFSMDVETVGTLKRGQTEIVENSWDYRWSVSGTVSLKTNVPERGQLSFYSPQDAEVSAITGSFHDKQRTARSGLEGEGGVSELKTYVHESWDASGVKLTPPGFELIVDTEKKTWSFDVRGQVSYWASQMEKEQSYLGESDLSDGEGLHVSEIPGIDLPRDASFGGPTRVGQLGQEAFGIFESFLQPQALTGLSPESISGFAQKTVSLGAGATVIGSFRWRVVRKLPEVELIVSGADYANWRPTAERDGKPGKPLQLKAELISPKGQSLSGVSVRQWRWKLLNTSREPGIALNFPLASKDTSPDLKLLSTRHKVETEGQTASRDPGGSKDLKDSLSISPHDWGGWSTLEVEAELEDRRIIKGHLRNRPREETAIRLPDRKEDSFIARAWANEKGVVGKPDKTDDEKSSLGLKGADGDGFSLYEEYRGFYENGRHVGGDPGEKDFFICNAIGDDARAGIALFTRLTQLRVHARLIRNEEFDSEKTQMNRNQSAGPQRVKQHGVFIFTLSKIDGGLTKHRSMPMRPHTCLGIALQPKNEPDKTLTTIFRLPDSDRPRVFDRAVAHELLHSIGVDHHGDDDSRVPLRFVFGDDPLDGPPDRLVWGSSPVRLLDEISGQDRIGEIAAERKKQRDFIWSIRGGAMTADAQASSARNAGMVGGDERFRSLPPEQQARHQLNRMLGINTYYLGSKQGQSSGNDQCVMRYYFADIYQKTASATDYFWINSDPEPAGLELCDSAKGTGINGPRKPEPRFGGAAAGRGDCIHKFAVNDAIP
jgi:hypothetical protein